MTASRSASLALVVTLGLTANVHAQRAQHRPDVSGLNGAVVSDHPLASAAGYEVLRRGGNAVDAAITMAAVLAVVRPHMNGVGGDAFGLFYRADSGDVTALNASGRAGTLATRAFFEDRGIDEMPGSGALTVTVPGAVSGWAAALERYGSISLADALAPAIGLAENGWVVTATLQRDVESSVLSLSDGGRAIFAPGGALPPVGAVLRNRPLARTLQQLASDGAGALYGGSIGARIAAFVEAAGGTLRPEDFAAHTSDWVTPLSISLPSPATRIYAMPPNSQGMVQLQALAMSSYFDVAGFGHNSADYLHTLIEIKKLAFADRDRWLADPATSPPIERLLDTEYLRQRAARVSPDDAAAEVMPGIGEALTDDPASGDGDTVYLMAVDSAGNAVSWIQSLFSSWGSGLVEPTTGVVLQNRGAGFTLDPRHPNIIAPGKRPFHTLTPMLVTDADGALRMTIGTPGGHGQPQFLLQVYHNLFTFGMTPQQAVEAPRFIHDSGLSVQIESDVHSATIDALRTLGHDVQTVDGRTATFGGMQVIFIDPAGGTLRTGADPRREAYGLAW